MDTKSDEILDSFMHFQKSFDEDQEAREKIREFASELEQLVRKTMTTLQGIHLEASGNYTHIVAKARECILPCREIYTQLGTCVGANFYRYHEHWRFVTQRASFCITLIEFLESQKLATKQEVAEQLSLSGEQSKGFHLDLEDYLHGLLMLVSELSRLAVNSAASGNYKWPVVISHFVNELNAGFRLMNFKNDSLRKHYDCFKYDLKKIEEVVYDLSIRGLKSTTDEGSGSAAANIATA